MDEKQSINDLVSNLDAFMSNGGSRVTANDIKKAEDAKKESSCNLFTSDVNDCPTCANIPNISDVDERE